MAQVSLLDDHGYSLISVGKPSGGTEFDGLLLPVAKDWDDLVDKAKQLASTIDAYLDPEDKLQSKSLSPLTLCSEQKTAMAADLKHMVGGSNIKVLFVGVPSATIFEGREIARIVNRYLNAFRVKRVRLLTEESQLRFLRDLDCYFNRHGYVGRNYQEFLVETYVDIRAYIARQIESMPNRFIKR